MSEMMKIKDVMDICEVTRVTVINWINRGFLPATRIRPETPNGPYMIKEDDLKNFMASENYAGKPNSITRSEIFNRIPVLEECYPINLLIVVNGIRINVDDNPPVDIWEYDIRQFRHLITLLTDREQRIIGMRYQLGMTLDEVGAAIGVHKERVRQISAKAERKLRHWMVSEGCRTVNRERYNELLQKNRELAAEVVRLKNNLDSCLLAEKPEELTNPKILLEELDLSVRSYNCLKRAGLDTLDDLIRFDQTQDEDRTWRSIRNLGRVSLMEVAEKVFNYCQYRIRWCDPKTKEWNIPFSSDARVCEESQTEEINK